MKNGANNDLKWEIFIHALIVNLKIPEIILLLFSFHFMWYPLICHGV